MATALGAILSPAGLVVAALVAVATIVVQNWGAVKKAIVDVANYFIDLYNESLAVRLIIQGFVALFKTIFVGAVAAVNGIINQFKIAGRFIKGLFSNVGKIIRGVFTLDRSMIKDGVAGLGDALTEGVTETANNVKGVFNEIGTADSTTSLKHLKNLCVEIRLRMSRKKVCKKELTMSFLQSKAKFPNFFGWWWWWCRNCNKQDNINRWE